MFNSNPCRRGWHSHLTISISCMLIKWVTLQLRLLQGYVGFLTTHFLSTAITSEAQKTQSSAGLSLAPLPIQQHRWNYLGLTLEWGRAPTSAQSLFCSSRSPRCSPAHCRVPVGGEYRSSWPAVSPPATVGPASRQPQPAWSPALARPLLSSWRCLWSWLAAARPSWNAHVPRKGFLNFLTLRSPGRAQLSVHLPWNCLKFHLVLRGSAAPNPTSLIASTWVCLNRACGTTCLPASSESHCFHHSWSALTG